MKARNWLLTTCFSLSVLLLVGGLTIAPPERVAAALQPQVTVKPSPRYGYTMVTISDTAYLFGGTNITPTQGILSGPLRPAGNLYDDIWAYRESPGWEEIEPSGTGPSPRHSHAATAPGEYAAALPLVSNPSLSWNTFLGSDYIDDGLGVAVDNDGNLYVAGTSNVGWGTPVTGHHGGDDILVARLSGEGALLWHTFVGGSGQDNGAAMAVDSAGNIYIVGTSTATFGAPIHPFVGGYDICIAKLNSAGALQWNTFFGVTDPYLFDVDRGYGVAVDGNGNVYATGSTGGTWGSPIRPFTGTQDAFVVKLNGDGALQWNTFLGAPPGYLDNDLDAGSGITVDGSGYVYVAGSSTASWGSPVRGYQGGLTDAFVARLNANTGALVWNTFLGGAGWFEDYGKDVAVDGSGNVYVTGHGQGPWSLPPVSGFKGMADVFVAKLDANGNWQWHTFLGSAGTEQSEGIALDTGGNIYVVGLGDQTWGSPFRPKAGPWDGFVAQLNNSGVLMWNAFLGSDNTISYSEAARGVAVDGTGKVNVVGWSMGTWGSPIRPYAGNGDAFVSQIGERPPGDVWLYLPLVLRYTP